MAHFAACASFNRGGRFWGVQAILSESMPIEALAPMFKQ
jgi:hypothetical protein